MIKKFSKFFRDSRTKGFTLIELLVVLGILGILAVAILAAINPIEQLNKAQDAAQENAATTFVSAVTQYYSVHNVVPFGQGGCGKSAKVTNQSLSTLAGCVKLLETEGELKVSFSNINTQNQKALFVSTVPVAGTTSTFTTFTCFKPQSLAVQNDPNTKYTNTTGGTTTKKCAAGKCYWCAQ